MSMDVIVWTTCALSFPSDLPEPDKWSNYGNTDWAYEAESWQVIVDKGSSLYAPEEVLSKNQSHTIPTFVVLEPVGANNEAYSFWGGVSESIAKKCGGATLQGVMGIVSLDSNGNEIK